MGLQVCGLVSVFGLLGGAALLAWHYLSLLDSLARFRDFYLILMAG